MPRPATRYRQKPHPISPKRKQTSLPSSSPRKDLQRRLAHKPIAKPLEDSDDSDKLVVKGAGGRRGRYLAKNEIFASGALQKGDQPGAHPDRTQRRQQMVEAQKHGRGGSSSTKVQVARSPETVQTQHRSSPRTVPTAPPSAVRLASAQPTPSRENSILDAIKPRKRQNSILRPPEPEDSSLAVTDDSFALPDDESTPLSRTKPGLAVNTPSSHHLPSSASRKRKLGASEPVRTSLGRSTLSKPSTPAPPAEPTLPPQSLSTLRESGRKQRQQVDVDDTDVMAPPMSSSSSTSPAMPKPSSVAKSQKPQPAPLLTEQLQSLMPTKRRKTTRSRATMFDIPPDSDSPNAMSSDPEDDSMFRPTRRRPPSRGAKAKNTSKAVPKKSRQKTSKPGQKASSKPTKAKSTVLTLSRSSGNQTTKSPSQPSTTAKTNTEKHTRTRARTRLQSIDPEAEWSSKATPSGGFPGSSDRNDTITTRKAYAEQGKENSSPNGDTVEVEVEVGRSGQPDLSVVEESQGVESPARKKGNMWDEIDNWSMDFEDISVYERSSELDAR